MSSSFPVRVLGARLIVKMDAAAESAIILTQKEKPLTGTVIATGPGMRLETGVLAPMDVSVGDRVLIQSMSGIPIDVPGEEGEFLVINEHHIAAVL